MPIRKPFNRIFTYTALTLSICLLSQCGNSVYASSAGTDCQSRLVTSKHTSAQPPIAAFLCVPFGYTAFTVELDGDTFACASFLCDLLTNPVQFYHPHNVVNGRTSLIFKELIMTNVDSKSTIRPERNINVFHSYMVMDQSDPKYKRAIEDAEFFTLDQAVKARVFFESRYPDRTFSLCRSTSFAHYEESDRGHLNTVELEDMSNTYQREWLRQVREAFANGLTEEAWLIKNTQDEEERERSLAQ